jgi:hypothetical protein
LEPLAWKAPCKALVSGEDCGDLLLGSAFEVIVSERVYAAYIADDLRGLASFERAHVVPRQSREYYVTRPRVTLTRLDGHRSGVRWKRPPTCELCMLGVRDGIDGIFLDESTWDGSDIFVASSLPGVIIVTERFVDWVADHQFSNFSFVSVDEYAD